MVAKLLAMLFSPVVRLISWAYRLAAGILSYALIGMAIICLIAVGAELYSIGMTQEAWMYLGLAIGSYAVRWVLLFVASLLFMLQEAVERRAYAPANNHYKDYYDSCGYY